ncbi:MAG: hypothetical protein ACI8SR_002933 [Oceanicoccus sp.]|jgi:hypothetical protein
MEDLLKVAVIIFIAVAAIWEFATGRDRGGKRTKKDWQMAFLATFMMAVVQRPVLAIVISVLLGSAFPASAGSLTWLQDKYFWFALLGYFCIEEFLHGGSHLFAHMKRPKNKTLQWTQAFYKMSHRPHHLSGGPDNQGQLTVIQTFINGWAWWFILPNFWFQIACLYLGLTEVFIIATVFKGLWAAHTHVNWNYDLYFLNHKYKWVRNTMWALCHVICFPTQHHQHHSRGKNSAKNVTATLAIYDWLIFKTLAIETTKPEIYGWRQSEDEANSVFKRYFNTNVKKYMPGR